MTYPAAAGGSQYDTAVRVSVLIRFLSFTGSCSTWFSCWCLSDLILLRLSMVHSEWSLGAGRLPRFDRSGYGSFRAPATTTKPPGPSVDGPNVVGEVRHLMRG